MRMLVLVLFAMPFSAVHAVAQPSIGIEIGPRGPNIQVDPYGPPRYREREDYREYRPRYDEYGRAQAQCRRLIAAGEYRTMAGCMSELGY